LVAATRLRFTAASLDVTLNNRLPWTDGYEPADTRWHAVAAAAHPAPLTSLNAACALLPGSFLLLRAYGRATRLPLFAFGHLHAAPIAIPCLDGPRLAPTPGTRMHRRTAPARLPTDAYHCCHCSTRLPRFLRTPAAARLYRAQLHIPQRNAAFCARQHPLGDRISRFPAYRFNALHAATWIMRNRRRAHYPPTATPLLAARCAQHVCTRAFARTLAAWRCAGAATGVWRATQTGTSGPLPDVRGIAMLPTKDSLHLYASTRCCTFSSSARFCLNTHSCTCAPRTHAHLPPLTTAFRTFCYLYQEHTLTSASGCLA